MNSLQDATIDEAGSRILNSNNQFSAVKFTMVIARNAYNTYYKTFLEEETKIKTKTLSKSHRSASKRLQIHRFDFDRLW